MFPEARYASKGQRDDGVRLVLVYGQEARGRLCSLCGASAELSPLLLGYESGLDT